MVFYFTATGNSLYVAKCIDEYFVSNFDSFKNSFTVFGISPQ